MLIEIKVPVLSESVSAATLVAWHKKEGDVVAENESLVDLETDKVVLEVVAPKKGILSKINKGDGVNVNSNEVIAVIDTDLRQVAIATVPTQNSDSSIRQVIAATAEVAGSGLGHSSGPAVRKWAAEKNLDLTSVAATGRGGRVTKGDIVRHLDLAQTGPDSIPIAPSAAQQRTDTRVPMSRLRTKVAERLKAAQNTAAILTTFNEVNMQPIMELRAKYKNEFLSRHDTKLGFMSFFTKASVEALRLYPIMNASLDGADIVYHDYYDIGIAIGSPRGLVVPILRDVDKLGFAEIEKAITAYGEQAKNGKLTLESLSGGTFSITNGGVFGSMLSTPILNPPQSAILGMHNIQDRAVVIDGQVVVRPMMYLALSYDHRIVDGQDAVLFLVAIKKAVEDPVRMLLDL